MQKVTIITMFTSGKNKILFSTQSHKVTKYAHARGKLQLFPKLGSTEIFGCNQLFAKKDLKSL